MGNVLWELWIIDKSGLALIHIRSAEMEGKQKISPFLFSGVLSAIEMMATKTIDAIKMQDSKIIIVPETDVVKLFFVGRVSISKKDKNVRKLLTKIRDQFIEEYEQILPSWSGDQAIFDYFIDIIKAKYFA